MLVNEIYHGGIRAIIAQDNTVFDSMSLPTGVALADVVDHIVYKYGDTPLFTPDPAVIKYYVGKWSLERLPLWNRYKAAIETQYKPLDNYNMKEKNKLTHGKKTTYAGSITDGTSGTIKVEQDDTTTNSISADNSSSWSNDTQSVLDGETNTSFTNYQQTRSFTNRSDTDSGTDLTEIERSGNIGVTTSQQMLESELDLIPRLDLIDYIATDWHDEFNLSIYY